MKKLLLVILILPGTGCFAQEVNSEFTNAVNQLYSLNGDSLYDTFAAQRKIPFVVNDSVAFLYKGKGNTVAWMGDFNGWGYYKDVPNQGKKIPNTNIWILKMKFPTDARLDYKIVIDETHWMLDPINPHQQWSGVGGGSPNSELRMPEWKEDTILIADPNAKQGEVINDILLQSKVLGYQVMYSIYLPPDYNPNTKYPTLYVTDGYEYMHPKMGNMITVLNNLIHSKKIEPILVVFVDQRNPINRAENRRMRELAMNKAYLSFYLEELLPEVERNYSVKKGPEHQGILGTSMGGLNAAYFSFSRPDIFGLSAIQSPAFSYRNEIYTTCENAENPPVKIFLSAGSIYDAKEGADKMRGILENTMCTYQFAEVNESHSWGQWRNLLDDILVYFFPLSN